MTNLYQRVAWIGQGDAAAHRGAFAQHAGVDVTYLDPSELADTNWDFDAVITACTNETELREVALGKHGLLRHTKPGVLYIESSHISEALSREIAQWAQGQGVRYLRAPVTKPPASGSEDEPFTAMVSGPQEVFDAARSLVEGFAGKIFFLGENEEARAMTRVLDVMSGVTLAMWAEALVFGEAVGLDWLAMLNVMETSAIGSPLIKEHTPAVSGRNFTASPRCSELTERLGAALEHGKATGVVLTLTGVAHQMYLGALRQFGADADETAIIPWLEAACGQDGAR